MSAPLAVLGVGMVTGVGLSAPASCAAIRCGINKFEETHFIAGSRDWVIGSEVPMEQPWRGVTRLAKMAALAVNECLNALPAPARAQSPLPVVLCIAEEDRPGRLPGLGGPLLFEIEQEIGIRFHPGSTVIPHGRVGGALGLLRAQELLYEGRHQHVILVGVDTYLCSPTLAGYARRNRVLTADNSDGFIPGEGAGAVLLTRADGDMPRVLTCSTPGFARESASIEAGQPFRADGMVQAVRSALAAAGIGLERVDHRISDLSGEQYRFKEVALATARILRERKLNFGIWHPADCVGETGAAALPIMLGVLHCGARKRYLPGPVFLAYLSNDDDKRAAVVLSARGAA
jgi:3-oxoacyl-[acyl-carrier-protein] synthase-1